MKIAKMYGIPRLVSSRSLQPAGTFSSTVAKPALRMPPIRSPLPAELNQNADGQQHGIFTLLFGLFLPKVVDD